MKTLKEELIDFLYWRENEINPTDAHNLIDKYLESIDSASNESLSVAEIESEKNKCNCADSTWNRDAECFICDECGKHNKYKHFFFPR